MTIDFTNPAGKGAQPRPFSDYEQYKSNWDLIFNKKNLQSSDDEGKKINLKKLLQRKIIPLMKINLHKFYKPIGEILWASFYL